MAASPELPVGLVDPTLPRRLPEILRSATPPEPVRLPILSPKEARVTQRGPLIRAGMRRLVPAMLSRRASISYGADGRTFWSLSVASPGAKQLRVHFADFDVGLGEVWVFMRGG